MKAFVLSALFLLTACWSACDAANVNVTVKWKNPINSTNTSETLSSKPTRIDVRIKKVLRKSRKRRFERSGVGA